MSLRDALNAVYLDSFDSFGGYVNHPPRRGAYLARIPRARMAKLDKNDSKAKSLQKENKKLWDDFNAAKKELSTICAGFTKEASGRVKQYADASNKALEGLKSQGK